MSLYVIWHIVNVHLVRKKKKKETKIGVSKDQDASSDLCMQ